MNITIQGVKYDSEKVIKVINGRPYLLVAKANLTGAYLRGATLGGADLSGAYLRGANLYYADLYHANLSNANLHKANLTGAYLNGANLNGATLTGANLYGADLSGATLTGALGLDKVLPYAPNWLPDGYAYDTAKGIYLKPVEPVKQSCSHTQSGPYCSTCGEKL